MSDIGLIKRLFAHYKSRKRLAHQAYGRFLPEYRTRNPCKLLEIGVLHGGSMRAWKEYFDHPQLFAIDIDAAHFEGVPSDTLCFPGDQSDLDFLADCVAQTGPLDIVIDDGSHRTDHQQITFEMLWPHVKPGGLYVIEDMESSLEELWRHKERWKRRKYVEGFKPTPDWLYAKARDGIRFSGPASAPDKQPFRVNAMYSFFSTGCYITKGM